MNNPSLLDAIRVVKENERVASASYADAAKRISNPIGRKLFEQLSEFELFHYEKISALEKSLEETGEYIEYEGREFPLPPLFESPAAAEPSKKSVMSIISGAMELEKVSEKAYGELASQTVDPRGHEMFDRLSEEEHQHYRLLLDTYWTLNNLGIWKWVRPGK